MSTFPLISKLRSSRAFNALKPSLRFARRFINACFGNDHLITVDVVIPKLKLGNDWADWVVATRLIEQGSPIVYSVGLGRDISFDLAMISQFGCDIFGFDPTPISGDYLRSIPLPAKMHVYPYGLAVFDGTKDFGDPVNGDVSFSTATGKAGSLNLEVRKLSSIMAMLGHDRVDLLKLDIEGDEYECINQLIAENIMPDQLFVEFHHGFYDIPLERTRRSIKKLYDAGYRIFDVSPIGREFSFIHTSAIARAGR